MEIYEKKQKILNERIEKFNKKELLKQQEELVYFQFLKFFKCVKDEEEDNDKDKGGKNNKNQVN